MSVALKRQGYKMIPSNVVIDKTLPGLGITYMEVHAKRPSIIIEPNVPVIIGKAEGEDNCLAVYELCTKPMIRKFLQRKDLKYKKLITTPEGFGKIKKVAKALGIDIFKEYFCLFDECEKIIQDVDYRSRIAQPINDFFEFEGKAMVSATPLEMRHPKLREQGFRKLKIIPLYDYRKDMTLIPTRSFDRTVKQQLRRLLQTSSCICIFFNSTNGINSLVNFLLDEHLIAPDEYKIFCSKKSVDILKDAFFYESFEELKLPLAKVNLFTCRFFSAVDITTWTKPDVLILTDCVRVPHSIIDPFTEAIQAQGRFRNKYEDGNTYNSLTVIANVNENMEVLTDEEVTGNIEVFKEDYEDLKVKHDKEQEKTKKKARAKELKVVKYNDLLDDDDKLNYFAVDNWYNEERVKRYYLSAEALYQAYMDCQFFNINYQPEEQGISEEDKLQIKQAESKKAKWRKIVDNLERVEKYKLLHPDYDMEAEISMLREFEDTGYIIDAYLLIGAIPIRNGNFNKTQIDKEIKAYRVQKARDERFAPDILKSIWQEFQPDIEAGQYISFVQLKDRVKRIFQAYGILFKEKGKQLANVYVTLTNETITDYFDCKKSNAILNGSYKLIAMKPELVQKIEESI